MLRAVGVGAIREHDRVIMTAAKPEERLELEMWGLSYTSTAIAQPVEWSLRRSTGKRPQWVETSAVRPISDREITHARTFAR
jgi:hypothetical protein